jgi:hypothetical protein
MHNHLAQSGVQVTNGAAHIPARAVDFCVDSAGPLAMFLPASPEAEVWALTGGFQGHIKWLGVFLVEQDRASIILGKLLADGFRVRLDGRLI